MIPWTLIIIGVLLTVFGVLGWISLFVLPFFERFEVVYDKDKEIIQAGANHTFGCRGMCNLAKILFAADKIEPGRDYITNSYIKKLLKQDLDDVIKTVLSDNISYLKKKGKKVALETELLYASLQ